MTTTNENIEVVVPACFIKDKAVDFDGEAYAAMGGCLPIGGFLVRPPSLGVFSIMETYESNFIADPANCSIMEFWRVLFINEHRRSCLQDAMAWAYPDKGATFDAEDDSTWQSWDWEVYEWGKALELSTSIDELSEPYVEVHKWFNLAFEGFDMIPGGGGNGECWFGADAVGSLSAALSERVDSVLWDVSMCAVGHKLAALCKQNGNEHVKRKKDLDDVKLQLKEAKQRVRDGVLHPWQLADPEQWPLESVQVKYAPKLIDQWEALAKERKNGS